MGTLRTAVEVLANMTLSLNLDDWTGDPCVPVPYDWLKCEKISALNNNNTSLNNQTISGGRGEVTAVITNM